MAGLQYTVKDGDTLWDIAQANGVSVNDLIQANNLSDADELTLGEVLRFPVTADALQRSATLSHAEAQAQRHSGRGQRRPTSTPERVDGHTAAERRLTGAAGRRPERPHRGGRDQPEHW